MPTEQDIPTEQEFRSAKAMAEGIWDSQRRMTESLARNLIGVEIDIKIKGTKPMGYNCVRFYVERKIEPEKAKSLRRKLGRPAALRLVSVQSHAAQSRAGFLDRTRLRRTKRGRNTRGHAGRDRRDWGDQIRLGSEPRDGSERARAHRHDDTIQAPRKVRRSQ